MSLNGAAYMQIQWIDMVYNVTKDNEKKRSLDGRVLERDAEQDGELIRRDDSKGACKVVCSIDEADEAGETKILSKSAASHMLNMRYWTRTIAFGIMLLAYI